MLKRTLEITPSGKTVHSLARLHRYHAYAANSRGLHGVEPRLWIYDELAQARDIRLFDALAQSQPTVRDPLGFVLSTMSDRPGQPLADLVEVAKREQAAGRHRHYLIDIHQAARKDKPFKFRSVRKANPALGHFVDEKYLRDCMAEARKNPARRAGYEAYTLNRDAGAMDALIGTYAWQQCGYDTLRIEDYYGKSCNVGMDLSLSTSLTAVAVFFPDDNVLFCDAWLPEGKLAELQEAHRAPYKLWLAQGFLRTTPGKTIELEPILSFVGGLQRNHQLRSVRYDVHRAPQFRDLMERQGMDLPLRTIKQTHYGMGPPTERFLALIESGKLRHADNPVLNQCVYNTVAVASRREGQESVIPGKAQGLPNDCCVAAIEAAAILEGENEDAAPEGPAVFSLQEELDELEAKEREQANQ